MRTWCQIPSAVTPVVVQEVAGSSPVTHPRRRVFGGPVRGHLSVTLVSSFVLGGDPPDPHGAIGSDPAWGCALRFARASGPPFPSRDLSSGNGSALGRVLLICVPGVRLRSGPFASLGPLRLLGRLSL